MDKDYKTNNFYIEDETGKIFVQAEGHEIMENIKLFSTKNYEFIDYNGIQYNTSKIQVPKEIDTETIKELLTLKNFSKKYEKVINIISISEKTFAENDEIYVLGNVEVDEKGNKVIKNNKDNLFVISEFSELKNINILRNKSIIYTIGGIVSLTITASIMVGIMVLV